MSDDVSGQLPGQHHIAEAAAAFLAAETGQNQAEVLSPEEQAVHDQLQREVAQTIGEQGLTLMIGEEQTIDSALNDLYRLVEVAHTRADSLERSLGEHEESRTESDFHKLIFIEGSLALAEEQLDQLVKASDLSSALTMFRTTYDTSPLAYFLASITTDTLLSKEQRKSFLDATETLVGSTVFSRIMHDIAESPLLEESQAFNEALAEDEVNAAEITASVVGILESEFNISSQHDDFQTLALRIAAAQELDINNLPPVLQKQRIRHVARIEQLAQGCGLSNPDIDRLLQRFAIERPPTNN